jgi:FkbM family methyltransferase
MVERATRGWVLKRTMQTADGPAPILVSPDAQLKYLKPGTAGLDSDLVGLAGSFVQPGDVVWDVGANIGTFTFAAAMRRPRQVLAIEADPWLADLLRRTARLPTYRGVDIQILCAAAGATDGVAHFLIAMRGRASNALEDSGGRSQMGGVRERLTVPVLSLATVADRRPPPDVIKIDVEGAEVAVLEGAAPLLDNAKPLIYCEVGAEQFAAVAALANARSYALHDAQGRPTARADAFNYFLVPRDRLAEPRYRRFTD